MINLPCPLLGKEGADRVKSEFKNLDSRWRGIVGFKTPPPDLPLGKGEEKIVSLSLILQPPVRP
jgi:hypothetical protein